MKKLVIAIATAAVLIPTASFAGERHNDNDNGRTGIQYTGPVETVTVAQLLEDTSMFTEKQAIVEGHLVKQLNHDTFIFSDGTKEIQVELDDDIQWPTASVTPAATGTAAANIDATTKVRLFGEYEGGNTPEIEVDRIQVL
ncbi:NirD/YgiW/YdeI family stress tolerance protein [Photobacterium japonica]|uniref:YgiW/YdeI family stress tolerance OB fold protein n=1 Tax=Photobacterium japonica TaxID=2910235 RepID=UPI003D0DA97D